LPECSKVTLHGVCLDAQPVSPREQYRMRICICKNISLWSVPLTFKVEVEKFLLFDSTKAELCRVF